MYIGIDIRPLMQAQRTGVGEYTVQLLHALFARPSSHQYILFYNAYHDCAASLPEWSYPHVHVVSSRLPNKLFHLLIKAKLIALDRWIVQHARQQTDLQVSALDILFFPNIHITHVRNARHVQTVHDISFLRYPETFSLWRRIWHWVIQVPQLCQRADAIVVPSLFTKQDVVQACDVPEKKVHVIAPGVAPVFLDSPTEEVCTRVKTAYALPERFFLCLATLEPRKNICASIRAFQRSRSAEKGYEFIIAGARGWRDRKIMRLIEQTRGVRYIGYVSDEDRPALYTLATLFVYPSRYEGFGLPVLEAMQCGTPVITSDCTSLPEVTQGAAYIVNPHNEEAIAEGMRRLAAHSGLRQYYRDAGNKQAAQYDWHTSAAALETVFENL